MARTLNVVKLLLTNIDPGDVEPNFDEIRVEYEVTDGDLRAYKAWIVTGVDTEQNLTDFWADVIATVSGMEGI